MKAKVTKIGGGKIRQCAECGETYHRRDKQEKWAVSKNGLLHKLVICICIKCAGIIKKGKEYGKPIHRYQERIDRHVVKTVRAIGRGKSSRDTRGLWN